MQSHDCIPLHAGTPGSDSRRDLSTRQLADTTLMGLYLAPITEKVPTDAVSGLPPNCHHFFLSFFNIYLAVLDLSCVMWDLSLRRVGSVVEVCGFSCPAVYRILVLRPGIKPMSPALQGRFLTTGPPG